MLFTGSRLKVGDNSGALKVACIKVMSRSKYRWAQLTDVVLISVKRIKPHKRVKKKEKLRFLLVNTKKGIKRIGQVIYFVQNGGVISKKEDPVPLASRVSLVSPFEFRKNFRRVVTMSSVNV
jgi:large subunit ribosomal protein L14